jgi:hypothetical protein
MATLTSSETFTVADAAVEMASVSVPIIAASGVYQGTGRLIHPTLGTYDYARAPNNWSGIDGDIMIPPIWSSTKTLLGSANTLFAGDIRDVTAEETWAESGVAMEAAMARMLISFWMNPPDPSVGYVQWWPSYTSELGFEVILLELTIKGKAITFDSVSHNGWVRGPVNLKLKIVGRVE